MANSDKFSIEITAEETREDGLLSIRNTARRHCDVLAYVVSRERYEKSIRKQDEANRTFRQKLDRNGLYILWEPRIEGGRCKLYVGQTKSIEWRVNQHNKADAGPWETVVAFTTRSLKDPLNKTQLDYLEAKFYDKAIAAGRCEVTNKVPPIAPRDDQISDRDEQDAAKFFEEAISFLPMIGINAFLELDKPKEAASVVQDEPKHTGYSQKPPSTEMPMFYLFPKHSNDWNARGYPLLQQSGKCHFMVLKDSQARLEPFLSLEVAYSGLRKELIKGGVLVEKGKHLVFTRDYEFKSPSSAAAVIVGHQSNGRKEWKDEKGSALGDYLAA